ncbi:MAG: gliding motility-associated C-terminal domain-containing protein [Bacteroidota bacterium]
MHLSTHLKGINSYIILFVLSLLPITKSAYGQCAGTDNDVTVCEKDTDSNNRTYTLFDKLGGSPTPGGTWETNEPANFFALDRNTGIVDLWRINSFGSHRFTYVNDSCGESATVTIHLGGYPGEDNIDGSANACGDEFNVNLHRFLGSDVDGKVQDFNGVWAEDPSTITNQLNDNEFNAQAAGPGVYIFTYTIAAVSSCPSRTSTVILEVHPPANSGFPTGFQVCANADFSSLTNFDLNSLLVGESPNGLWSEVGTNQLENLTDHTINIEEINTNFGHGTYTFTYTVYRSHAICEDSFSQVTIEILPVFSGNIAVANYCLGEDHIVDLNYDDTLFPNGDYTISYEVNGISYSTPEFDVRLENGSAQFVMNTASVILNQSNTIEITGIGHSTRNLCASVNMSPTTFTTLDPSISTNTSCAAEEMMVELNDILDLTGVLATGTFDVDYEVTDTLGATINGTASNVSFSAGNSTFGIAGSLFTIAGDYTISADVQGDMDFNCTLQSTVSVIPIPEDIALGLIVDNSCDATNIAVSINAPALGDGAYQVTYNVIRSETQEVLITNTIDFIGGSSDLDIDLTNLAQGNYQVRLASTQNDTTPCRTVFDFEETANFAIAGIPEVPQAEENQQFCLAAYLPGVPTIGDLEVTASGALLFYATETDDVILPFDEPLVHGADYYISNIDTNNNCEGSDRIRIEVALTDLEEPTTADANPLFCAVDAPTVANLSVNGDVGNTITWFDAAIGGNTLDNSTPLIDGEVYYAATQNGICTSTVRLPITPQVISVPDVELITTHLSRCGLDNPTVMDFESLIIDTPYEVLWYNEAQGGAPLSTDTLLDSETTYYAAYWDAVNNCENPERLPITIDLSDCIPEAYDFFIPDGFSPNADGRNDLFYIPNIDVIFPDFTLEIFNRYGRSIFKGDRNRPAWDGKNGNTYAANGIYFYIITYNKDELEPLQGRLYLNR